MKLSRQEIRRIVESVINEEEKADNSIANTKAEVESSFSDLKSMLKNDISDGPALTQLEIGLNIHSAKIYNKHLKPILDAPGARNGENISKTIEAIIKKYTDVAMSAKKEQVKVNLLKKLDACIVEAIANLEVSRSALQKMLNSFK